MDYLADSGHDGEVIVVLEESIKSDGVEGWIGVPLATRACLLLRAIRSATCFPEGVTVGTVEAAQELDALVAIHSSEFKLGVDTEALKISPELFTEVPACFPTRIWCGNGGRWGGGGEGE